MFSLDVTMLSMAAYQSVNDISNLDRDCSQTVERSNIQRGRHTE